MLLLIDLWADIDRLSNIDDALCNFVFIRSAASCFLPCRVLQNCNTVAVGRLLPLPGLAQATSPPLLVISFFGGSRQSDLDLVVECSHVRVCVCSLVGGLDVFSYAIRPA